MGYLIELMQFQICFNNHQFMNLRQTGLTDKNMNRKEVLMLSKTTNIVTQHQQ